MVKEINPIFAMIDQNYEITGLHRIVQQFWLAHNQYYLSTHDESNGDTTIYTAEDVNGGATINPDKFYLKLKNTGHTQSLFILKNPNDGQEYLFTGTHWQTEWYKQHESKIKWTIDISLIPTNLKQTILTDAKWSKYPKIIGLQNLITSGKLIKRAEFAITPNQKYLLVAVNDSQDNAYFAIYAIADIWQGLKNNSILDISTINPIKKLFTEADKWNALQKKINKGLNTKKQSFSFQGFGVDDSWNIYISSQFVPSQLDSDKKKGNDEKKKDSAKLNYGLITYPRCIAKISDFSDNLDNWALLNLTNKTKLDQDSLYTEFENFQVNSYNTLNLVIGYHEFNNLKQKSITLENKIYYLSWFEL